MESEMTCCGIVYRGEILAQFVSFSISNATRVTGGNWRFWLIEDTVESHSWPNNHIHATFPVLFFWRREHTTFVHDIKGLWMRNGPACLTDTLTVQPVPQSVTNENKQRYLK